MAGHPLDNAVWHSLTGPRRALGERAPHAARFDPDVSPFAAIPDEPTWEAWADLARLVGADGFAVLFRRSIDPPASWRTEYSLAGIQMVAGDIRDADSGPDGDEILELEPTDVPEMLDLVAATQPGPFGTRTIEFGGYIGIRRAGHLVAMAGERLRLDGYTEISAVCTDADHRGQGLAGRLVRLLVGRIRARGEEAFLHAAADNEAAIKLYDSLGFEIRQAIDAGVLRPAAQDSGSDP
jgi:ribosomal protein S18 acetylase RimI-like enzyme